MKNTIKPELIIILMDDATLNVLMNAQIAVYLLVHIIRDFSQQCESMRAELKGTESSSMQIETFGFMEIHYVVP